MRPRVWAPLLDRLSIEVEGERSEMLPEEDGWFVSDRDLGHGTDYWLVLQDRRLPDPKSPFQPLGIDGPSRSWSHSGFEWKSSDWQGWRLEDGPIYEMHLGTFTDKGTFISTVEKLDHLVDLGVAAIELMPVAEFSGSRGWGYDGVLLYAPHHAYGDPDELKMLVDECHGRGLGVILDVVYNHLGPVGNHLSQFGPYFTDRYGTPWGEAVNLDGPGSDEVRRFFINNALMWLGDYRFDGLRLDAVHAIFDQSAINFLEELRLAVDELSAERGMKLSLIAESDLNDPRLIHPADREGYGLDAQWSDDFHHATHALLTREQDGYYHDFGSVDDVAKALRVGYVFTGQPSAFRERRHGREPVYVSGNSFVVCSQNHDQVGNRAFGERLVHLSGIPEAMVAAAMVLLSPHVPMLFQGEEWAASTPFLYFTDHQDPELGRQVREGRRAEFQAFDWQDEVPDPQLEETFTRSVLRWEETGSQPHAAMLEWYRSLIRIRRQERDLTNPDLSEVRTVSDGERSLTVTRGRIMIRFSFQSTTFEVGGFDELLLSSFECEIENGSLVMPPMSVVVLRL